MKKEDLSIFSIEDLQELKESASSTYKLIKKQVGDIPTSEIPIIKLVQLNSLKTKIKLYESELNSRGNLNKEVVQVQKDEKTNWKSKIRQYIASNQSKKAIAELIILSEGNGFINIQVLLLSNRLKIIKYNERNTLRNNEEISIEKSKINHAILDLLEDWD